MIKDIVISMPEPVADLIKRLNACGYGAYIVGGCVRDSIIGRSPNDWDICTSAKPDQVMQIFSKERVIATGLQHGTVTVVIGEDSYEITTYRIDGEYSDNRRPDSVNFTDDLIQDLSRRDFTINAMAYSQDKGLIDPFGGLDDINNQVIRCVGDANTRFEEDALRILRAVRFACQLNYAISQETSTALNDKKTLLKNISRERICNELTKMIVCESFPYKLCCYRNIFYEFMPEMADMDQFDQRNPYHDRDVFMHTLWVVHYSPEQDLIVRLAALLHDIGKPHCFQEDEDGTRHFKGHGRVSASLAYNILERLRFDADTISKVVQLIHYHDATFEVGKKYVKRWLNKIGESQFRRLIKLREADIRGQKEILDHTRIDKLTLIENDLNSVLESDEPFSIKHLDITGDDLISIGYSPSPIMGIVMRRLLDAVVEGSCTNDKHDLLDLAGKWKENLL